MNVPREIPRDTGAGWETPKTIQPMTQFGRVLEGVTGDELLRRGFVKEGTWNGLRTWLCKHCANARPFREDLDEILHHFATMHAEELRTAGLTEQPEPVRVQSSLVDEFGKPMFFEV